jgi:hypothetical protein
MLVATGAGAVNDNVKSKSLATKSPNSQRIEKS